MSKPRVIAFYLPQFYPTPENDRWWGKGFTEWTNVAKAKPLYKGHYQPHIPADLGFYDLRLHEVREEQAELAREAGIEGFCYWHYWTDGKMMLDRVFSEVVNTGKPDFPFCLCWANHHWWKKSWTAKGKDEMLLEQKYPGKEDYIAHFNHLLPAFKDKRYIRVDGKLLFGVFLPNEIPDVRLFMQIWNDLAVSNNLGGFYFFAYLAVQQEKSDLFKLGYNGIVEDLCWQVKLNKGLKERAWSKFKRDILKLPYLISYKDYVDTFISDFKPENNVFPCILPNFDHSPRSLTAGLIFDDSSPKLFGKLCKTLFNELENRPEADNLVFIKAWNEWGEGNHMEPDLKFGKGYINQLREAIEETK